MIYFQDEVLTDPIDLINRAVIEMEDELYIDVPVYIRG